MQACRKKSQASAATFHFWDLEAKISYVLILPNEPTGPLSRCFKPKRIFVDDQGGCMYPLETILYFIPEYLACTKHRPIFLAYNREKVPSRTAIQISRSTTFSSPR